MDKGYILWKLDQISFLGYTYMYCKIKAWVVKNFLDEYKRI